MSFTASPHRSHTVPTYGEVWLSTLLLWWQFHPPVSSGPWSHTDSYFLSHFTLNPENSVDCPSKIYPEFWTPWPSMQPALPKAPASLTVLLQQPPSRSSCFYHGLLCGQKGPLVITELVILLRLVSDFQTFVTSAASALLLAPSVPDTWSRAVFLVRQVSLTKGPLYLFSLCLECSSPRFLSG